jgi:hypothetical protein
VAEVAAAPQTGFLATEEIRFAVDPRRALLLTWVEGFDNETALHGDDDIAAELNRAVIAQADREWFHHPVRRTTRLKASHLGDEYCRPIGHQLDPQYGTPYARNSHRRASARKLLDNMIDEEISDGVLWTGVVLEPELV